MSVIMTRDEFCATFILYCLQKFPEWLPKEGHEDELLVQAIEHLSDEVIHIMCAVKGASQ